jgi:uncharacterized protein YbaR (Trm112 family)
MRVKDEPFEDEDGEYVLCPYCATPLSVALEAKRLEQWPRDPDARNEVLCDTCGLDVTADAPTSVAKQLAHGTRPCVQCTRAIRERAMYCHHCRNWQR